MENIKYCTVNDILADKKYPFTKGQIRGFLLKKNKNGLDKCIRKIGKRLYIRIDLFDNWIESQAI